MAIERRPKNGLFMVIPSHNHGLDEGESHATSNDHSIYLRGGTNSSMKPKDLYYLYQPQKEI